MINFEENFQKIIDNPNTLLLAGFAQIYGIPVAVLAYSQSYNAAFLHPKRDENGMIINDGRYMVKFHYFDPTDTEHILNMMKPTMPDDEFQTRLVFLKDIQKNFQDFRELPLPSYAKFIRSLANNYATERFIFTKNGYAFSFYTDDCLLAKVGNHPKFVFSTHYTLQNPAIQLELKTIAVMSGFDQPSGNSCHAESKL